MPKKNFLIAGSIALICIGLFILLNEKNFFEQSSSLDNLASIFNESHDHHHSMPLAQEFSEAIEHKNYTFFADQIEPSTDRTQFISIMQQYPLVMDVNTLDIANTKFLFFSFQGVEKESNRLQNFYGYWNSLSHEIFFMPVLSIQPETNSEANSFINTSRFPLVLHGQNLLLPGDKQVSVNKEIVRAQEKFFITPDIQNFSHRILENIDQGIQITIQN